MALSPIPHVVKSSGAAGSAPEGAIPIDLYGASSGGSEVTSSDITDATAIGRDVLTASSAAEARTAIGAAPTDHNQAATTITVSAIAGLTGANVQLALADLAARVAALESP